MTDHPTTVVLFLVGLELLFHRICSHHGVITENKLEASVAILPMIKTLTKHTKNKCTTAALLVLVTKRKSFASVHDNHHMKRYPTDVTEDAVIVSSDQ